jgi:thiol-disulfide isomerase/thioredoxin
MKNTLLLLFVLFPYFAEAQNSFTIKGRGGMMKDGDQIFLQYKLPTGVVNDSVIVSDHEFLFKGTIGAPVRASLYRNQNPRYADEMFDFATVYLEKGNIVIASADTLLHVTNSGTPLNEDYAQLAAALLPFNEKGRLLRDPFNLSATELKDTAFVAAVTKKVVDHSASMVPVKFAFIDAHPTSFVSLITLSELVRDSKNLREVDQRFSRLSPSLRNSAVGVALQSSIAAGKKIKLGSHAPDFSQPDNFGKLINLSDFKGKYILLDFWASWCGPCRAENPNLLVAYDRYKDKGFSVVSVSIDEAKDKIAWLKAIEEDRMPWTQLADLKGNQNVPYRLYGITTIPANVLISPEGIVIARDLKREELHAKLASLFK